MSNTFTSSQSPIQTTPTLPNTLTQHNTNVMLFFPFLFFSGQSIYDIEERLSRPRHLPASLVPPSRSTSVPPTTDGRESDGGGSSTTTTHYTLRGRAASPASSIESPVGGAATQPVIRGHLPPRPMSPRYFRPPPGGGPHFRGPGPPPPWVRGPRPPFDPRFSPRGMPRRHPMGPRGPPGFHSPRSRLPGGKNHFLI